MIGGLIITGETPKTVLVRAIGPSLTQFGIRESLRHPSITLHDGTGAAIASGTGWDARWTDAGTAPADPNEPVIRTTLPPGNYTVVLAGGPGETGTALIEVYDLQPNSGRMAAIATRGKVGTADEVMIGGFIITGNEPGRVVVRAVGPSLTPYGVQGALQDPMLELYDGAGSLIFSNDNWRTSQEQQLIDSTIPPADDREAAIAATLPPGNYTAIVRGNHGTTGVALVEVYSIDQ